MTVGDLAEPLAMSLAAPSNHIKVLDERVAGRFCIKNVGPGWELVLGQLAARLQEVASTRQE